jgi:hypothetical protein
MPYRNYLFIFVILFITNCTSVNLNNNKSSLILKNNFSNKGFAIVYNNDYYTNKIITTKMDERSLVIFQKNLKTNTKVKITNILNNKSIIASVGKKSGYPLFNNSVLSIRIANELELDIDEPYIEILEIFVDSMFVAKKAKTYEEEKNVASKAPVNDISINDLNNTTTKKKEINKKFSYNIKIADFYFKDAARMMTDRIINETFFKYPKIKKISKEKYRVYLGPFNNINSLQKSYNDINILEFDNIEIIRND